MSHRNTIYLEDTEIVSHNEFQNDQFIITLRAPKVSVKAKPGQFVHLQCDESIPMRRPLSILAADIPNNCISIMYRPMGDGLRILSKKIKGETINILGPIGNGFQVPQEKTILALGGGVGIPPVYFQSEKTSQNKQPCLLFMGSEIGFPFDLQTSTKPIYANEPNNMLSLKALNNPFIQTRLASLEDHNGVHKGYVTDLARNWINNNSIDTNNLHIIACGPEPMLEAVAKLAHEFDVACDIAVEEFMACAIGGCAGCAIKVHKNKNDCVFTYRKHLCI